MFIEGVPGSSSELRNIAWEEDEEVVVEVEAPVADGDGRLCIRWCRAKGPDPIP